MKKWHVSPRWSYLAVVAVASAVPAFHYGILDQELEYHRYPWGLMPAHLLGLRHLALVAMHGPVIAAGMFLASWKFMHLDSYAYVLRVAVLCLVLATCYAAYCVAIINLMLR